MATVKLRRGWFDPAATYRDAGVHTDIPDNWLEKDEGGKFKTLPSTAEVLTETDDKPKKAPAKAAEEK